MNYISFSTHQNLTSKTYPRSDEHKKRVASWVGSGWVEKYLPVENFLQEVLGGSGFGGVWDGGKREVGTLKSIQYVAVDFDETFLPELDFFVDTINNSLVELFGESIYFGCGHTPSSCEGNNRYRVIIPLEKEYKFLDLEGKFDRDLYNNFKKSVEVFYGWLSKKTGFEPDATGNQPSRFMFGCQPSKPSLVQGGVVLNWEQVTRLPEFPKAEQSPNSISNNRFRDVVEGERVGDVYNENVQADEVIDLLERHGFEVVGSRNGREILFRGASGKPQQDSSYNTHKKIFHSFTPKYSHLDGTPFHLYAQLECSGDYTEASRRLAKELQLIPPISQKCDSAPAPLPVRTMQNGSTDPKNPSEQPQNFLKKSDEYLNILRNLGYDFRMNELDDSLEVHFKGSWSPMTDATRAQIRVALRDCGLKNPQLVEVEDVYLAHASAHSYHPIKAILKELPFDKKDHIKHLSTFFEDEEGVFGAFFWHWIVGAVGKIMAGEQNMMLVLSGAQSLGKSYFVRWLAGPFERFLVEGSINTEPFAELQTNMKLCQNFVWEVAELGATTRKSDREALKELITRREATFKMPYARYLVKKPVCASFIGTINPDEGFLSDPTGNRRFNVVNLLSVNRDYSQKCDPKQIWGQAYWLWQNGAKSGLSEHEAQIRDSINQKHLVKNPITDYLEKYFTLEPNNFETFTSTVDIINILSNKGYRGGTSKQVQMEVARALSRHKRGRGTGREMGYYGVEKMSEF